MAALFAVTLLVSSSLLFLVQPMFGRMVLPLLGGSPAVWNSCMLFFQAALLAGYAYSHFTSKYLAYRKQILLHLALLLTPLLVLPIHVPEGWTPPAENNPIPWMLLLMSVAVGLPFVMVSTTAPLIQKWFSHSGHSRAGDPYFLYGASNAGSLMALLAYPLFVERKFLLAEQGWLWTAGYGLLLLLTGACAWIAYRGGNAPPPAPVLQGQHANPRANQTSPNAAPLTHARRWRWVALAAVPSSIMLGATTYVTTDVAAVPLLWVMPLSAYLLSFVFVFARNPLFSHRHVRLVFPIVFAVILMLTLAHVTKPIILVVGAHTLMAFAAALFCHGELAQDRPETAHLTEFYLWMSVGGVLGGIFNAIVAPVTFNTVLEYPLALVAACLFLPGLFRKPQQPAVPVAATDTVYEPEPELTGVKRVAKNAWLWLGDFNSRHLLALDLILPLTLTMVYAGIRLYVDEFEYKSAQIPRLLIATALALAAYAMVRRPQRYALAACGMLIVFSYFVESNEKLLHRSRSFFGVYRVRCDEDKSNVFLHGTTLHGSQLLDREKRKLPVTYYHKEGPVGQMFFYRRDHCKNVAVVGLGAGTLAAYAKAGDRYTFYEIDPLVKWVAFDSGYFHYCTDARERGAEVNVVLGDARLSMRDAPDKGYQMILVDAFTSDAIPVHLITREALALYMSKLAADGVLMIHISNRYLDLQPVLANLARDRNLYGRVQDESAITSEQSAMGCNRSHWVALAHDRTAMIDVEDDSGRWKELKPDNKPLWTDDYSNIFSVLDSW